MRKYVTSVNTIVWGKAIPGVIKSAKNMLSRAGLLKLAYIQPIIPKKAEQVIILISGKANHGKTSFAEACLKCFKKANISAVSCNFADALKDMARAEYDWDGSKDAQGRKLLQDLGSTMRSLDKDYWSSRLFKAIRKIDTKVVLVADTRYDDELEYASQNYANIPGYGMFPVRVVRLADGKVYKNKLTRRQQSHASETSLDNVEMPTLFIDNGMGAINRAAQEFVNMIVSYMDTGVTPLMVPPAAIMPDMGTNLSYE